MRKILNLLLIGIFYLFFISGVSAESIDCEYNDVGLTMTWDTDMPFNVESTPTNPHVIMGNFDSSKTETTQNILWLNKTNVVVTSKAKIDQKLYEEVLNKNGCNDKFYLCVSSEEVSDNPIGLIAKCIKAAVKGDKKLCFMGYTENTLAIVTTEEYKKNYKDLEDGRFSILSWDEVTNDWETAETFDDFYDASGNTLIDIGSAIFGLGDPFVEGSYTAKYESASCQQVTYNGPHVGVNINCGDLSEDLLKYMKIIKNYKDCDNDTNNKASCKSKNISDLKNLENKMKNSCSEILQSYNYSDGGQKDCIDFCLSLKTTLEDYKEGTDLSNVDSVGDCGLTMSIILWIANIVKWAKYFIPVLVIILGIIDFMKAVGADKDDEMKKAQGRFVKRLIAAALIFLIPLIIGFLLEITGFNATGCGIIDL